MTQTHFVRFGANTTEVTANDYYEAVEQACSVFNEDARFDVKPHHIDEVVVYRDDGDFCELFTDVHVTIDGDGEWTGSLTVETNEEFKGDREILYELDRIDELGLFGAYFYELDDTFEKNDVVVFVRGGIHDGERGGSVYVADEVSDL